MKKGLFSVMALLLTGVLAVYAQEEKKNQLDIDLNMLGHGELRIGGLSPVPDEDGGFDEKAQFLLGRTISVSIHEWLIGWNTLFQRYSLMSNMIWQSLS